MIEIRSYRHVFELERRIYRIDRLRLNPAGVPVRGIVYFLVLLAAGMVLAAVPLVSTPAKAVPWYLRALLFPAGLAVLLTVIRLEGRPFHLAAHALVRYGFRPRGPDRLAGPRAIFTRWRPPEIVVLPDGSDGRMRRLHYTGPGAALIAVEHERVESARVWRLRQRRWPGALVLSVRELAGARPLAEGSVIVLARRARLRVCRQNVRTTAPRSACSSAIAARSLPNVVGRA